MKSPMTGLLKVTRIGGGILAPLLASGLTLAPAQTCPETDGLKYVQAPDLTAGLDVWNGGIAMVLGDAWVCTNAGPVTDIRLWGGWLNDDVDWDATFWLGVYADVPASNGIPSHPGQLRWQQQFTPSGHVWTNAVEPLYQADAAGPSAIIGYATNLYQYCFSPIELTQLGTLEAPQTNWLAVRVMTTKNFGWKTTAVSQHHAAVFAYWDGPPHPPHEAPWHPVLDPSQAPLDLAFKITTLTDHCPPPTIQCGGNRTNECGAPITWIPPFAYDNCCLSNLTATFTETVTGQRPGVITRLWTATDCRGQTATCTQTVTLVDTAFPILTCASNKTVACQSRFVVLRDFSKDPNQGCAFSLTLGKDGVLYGTGFDKAAVGGTVFRLNRDGTGYQVLHRFPGFSGDGRLPVYPLVQGSDGALYGTTTVGGTAVYGGCGTVFTMSTDGNNYRVLHSFGDPDAAGGIFPEAGLMQGIDGAFYGTASAGGPVPGGTVFKLAIQGGICAFSVLYNFPTWSGGKYPYAGLVQGNDGASYGTTTEGGTANRGTLFRLDPSSTGYTVLHQFTPNDGGCSRATLIQGPDGSLYGTTDGRLGALDPIRGRVFKLQPGGGGYTYVPLHDFPTNCADGWFSEGALVQDRAGVLYGTMRLGGAGAGGTLFKLNADGSGFSTLYHFGTVGNQGWQPNSGLVLDADGAVYGTTEFNLTFNPGRAVVPAGTVFKLQSPHLWPFDAPTADDACCGTNVTITTLGTVTNGTCPLVMTRSWLVTDCCGRSNSCSQTVTIVNAPTAQEAWVQIYNGPANGHDWATAVAVDASGNVVVTGYSQDISGNWDYYTAKYAAADGHRLWEHRYNGPAGTHDLPKKVAVDASGNVVVTGSSVNTSGNQDYYTAKYAAADGHLLWEKPYNGPGNSSDSACDVALDASGNVVVTGSSFNSSGTFDYYTAKYAAADGHLLWEQRYNGPANGNDGATAVTVDAGGNVAVTGCSFNTSGTFDYYTAMYAAGDGHLLWEQRYNGPGNDQDQARAVAVDASGNVVVTGSSVNTSGNEDYYTAKYAAADGHVLWEQRYNGPGNDDDYAAAVAVDTSGNVVVTGCPVGSSGDWDYYTAKYAAADGHVLWEQRYNGLGTGSDNDAAVALAVDASGNVVVTGYSPDSSRTANYYTAKYAAADGRLLWEQRYNGPGNGSASARDVAVDASGNVVVTGASYNGANEDYATVKYTAVPVLNLTCPTNKTVGCGWDGTFDEPTAWSFCCGSNVTLTVVGTTNNGAYPLTVTRTWRVVDCCTNELYCSQSVTIADTNQVKYLQPPNLTSGRAVWTSNPYVLADDFACRNPGPITDIHLWCAWHDDSVDTNMPIWLGIYDDVPATANAPSHPGPLRWQHWFGPGDYLRGQYAASLEDFCDPSAPGPMGVDSNLFYYCFYPTNAFQQEGTVAQPKTYWLAAYGLAGANQMVGWKTSVEQQQDPAVWNVWPGAPPLAGWEPLHDPLDKRPLDLAFEITTGTRPRVVGDIDGNRRIDDSDTGQALGFAVQPSPPPPPIVAAADASRDGRITALDAVLIDRVAHGLAPLPTQPVTFDSNRVASVVRASNAMVLLPSGTVGVPVELVSAVGGELGVAFTLSWNAGLLDFQGARVADLPGPIPMPSRLNTNEVANGRLGFTLLLPDSPTTTLPPGTNVLLTLAFRVAPGAVPNTTAVGFTDALAIAELVALRPEAAARPVPVEFQAGAVTIGYEPQPLSVDTFNAGLERVGQLEAYCLAVQPDGKILVGGTFAKVGGQSLNVLARLNPDGTVDSAFAPQPDIWVYSLAVQTDRKILVGGAFWKIGGQDLRYLARLESDGSLDTNFVSGIDGYAYALVQPGEGKVVVGGWFSHVGGAAHSNLGRLNADGSLDRNFVAPADGPVHALALQADRKIVVGGEFTRLAGQPRSNLARLNADGTLDGSFNPGADSDVLTLAVQADGKILVGGKFTRLGGLAQALLGRLNGDGSLDTDFKGAGSGWHVASLAVQTDGRIVVGGRFTSLGGGARNHLGRLNPDGTSDGGFGFGGIPEVFGGKVNVVTIQPDGNILVGGSFATLAGQARLALGRLNNTGPAAQSFRLHKLGLTWLRGGTGPEVWRTTLDFSANGTTWTNLGPGTRIPSGWLWTGSGGRFLPGDTGFLRPRGFVAGSGLSDWFTESVERIVPASLEIRKTGVAAGEFGFTVIGSPGQVVEVQASSDLSDWIPVATDALGTDGSYTFRDGGWASQPQRYYRVRAQTH